MKDYLLAHLQNAVATLGALSRKPLSTALTVAVIGITLALPAGLYVVVRNGQALASGLADARDFSVYLEPGTPLDNARRLADRLGKRGGVASVRVVPADEALAELREDPAFASVAAAVGDNPLPHTLIVRPADELAAAELAELAQEIAAQPGVDLVKFDAEWVNRLQAILDTLSRAVTLIGILLLAAVVIVIGNTIRLDIQNRQQEIEVAKLLGATDAFVRRPFLYLGFWFGLLGGLVALLLLGVGLLILSGPLGRLMDSYAAGGSLTSLDTGTVGLVLLGGLLIGCGGAWTAVSRHLRAIQPRV